MNQMRCLAAHSLALCAEVLSSQFHCKALLLCYARASAYVSSARKVYNLRLLLGGDSLVTFLCNSLLWRSGTRCCSHVHVSIPSMRQVQDDAIKTRPAQQGTPEG